MKENHGWDFSVSRFLLANINAGFDGISAQNPMLSAKNPMLSANSDVGPPMSTDRYHVSFLWKSLFLRLFVVVVVAIIVIDVVAIVVVAAVMKHDVGGRCVELLMLLPRAVREGASTLFFFYKDQ